MERETYGKERNKATTQQKGISEAGSSQVPILIPKVPPDPRKEVDGENAKGLASQAGANFIQKKVLSPLILEAGTDAIQSPSQSEVPAKVNGKENVNCNSTSCSNMEISMTSCKENEEVFGPWLLVDRRKRPPRQNVSSQNMIDRNFFAKLNEVTEDNTQDKAVNFYKGVLPKEKVFELVVNWKGKARQKVEEKGSFINPFANSKFDNKELVSPMGTEGFKSKKISLVSEKHLKRIASDHRPILIDAKAKYSLGNRGRDFVFEYYWTEYEEINSRIKDKWDGRDWRNCTMEFLSDCLSDLGRNLKEWSKSMVDSLEKNLKVTMDEMEILEQVDKRGLCDEEDLQRLRSLTNKAKALNRHIHLKWWSKAREKWLDHNDKNIRYFHNLVKFKRRINTIHELNLNNITISESKQIASCFAEWYKELWKDDLVPLDGWKIVEKYKWKKLSWRNQEELTKSFSSEEIWKALSDMGRGKASGPDDFTVEFFIHYCSLLKFSVQEAFKDFECNAIIPSSWGESCLVFNPKKEDPKTITDYRPIALCNVVYKILSKLLVNWLKPLISGLVSSEQTILIEGRQLQDNILLSSEIINQISKLKRNLPFFILKLDLEKTFDGVSWVDLERIMDIMNFPSKFRNWLLACLKF
ncbi:hypothetical protein Cni_G06172 [Canna indica]|uniref:Reverse transcriptase domain-containing protein n=1 Tax=Canna indica TaxID=4628 RepID=A0AAQ3Q698_9LILI|nr:hypothetical protein Cni_G06172 [Canna indica]